MQKESLYPREKYIKEIKSNEIDLLDLAKFVLGKWKQVLILCVVIYLGWIVIDAFLNGGEQTNSSLREVSVEQLTEEQQKNIEDIISQGKKLETLEQYRETLAVMNLDPYTCNVNTLQYLISSETLGREIYEVYKAYAGSGGLKHIIEEKLGGEIVRPSDLVVVVSSQAQIENQVLLEKQKSYVIVLKVVSENDDMSEKITNVVKSALEEYHKYLLATMGEHDLFLLSESSYVGSDNYVKQKQSELEKEIEEKKIQIDNNENALDTNEKDVLEHLKNDGNNELDLDVPIEKQEKSIIRFLIAFILCMIVSCIVIVCYYLFIFGSRLRCGEEIMSIFGLPYIGEVSKKDLKVNIFRLKDEIESSCLGIKEDRVFISSMASINNIEKSFDIVKEELGQCNVQVLFGGNISENTEAMKIARDCKNMLLVFEERKTSYNSIDSVLQRCNNWGINIIGVINVR